jgi:hypothetical protein
MLAHCLSPRADTLRNSAGIQSARPEVRRQAGVDGAQERGAASGFTPRCLSEEAAGLGGVYTYITLAQPLVHPRLASMDTSYTASDAPPSLG